MKALRTNRISFPKPLFFPSLSGKMSYASIAAQAPPNTNLDSNDTPKRAPQPPPTQPPKSPPNPPQKRSPSPTTYRPKTSSPERRTYILTLLTNPSHHKTLTALRTQYFPPKLNKLDAHLTLFHALPGSKLDSEIIPTLEEISQSHHQFKVHANRAFRLKKGIAISVPSHAGGAKASGIHDELQRRWAEGGWLSEQDSRKGLRVHYTIMNKVDDEEEIERGMEVMRGWEGSWGVVEALGLWEYERGGRWGIY